LINEGLNMNINQVRLVQALAAVSGATFVGLDTETIPTLTGGKSNPMQGRVRKNMRGASVMVFQNKASNGYANMVERRLQAEGKDPASFQISPRQWGERVPNTPIVEHKGKVYLEVIFLKAGEVSYTLDGAPIAKADIAGLKESPEGEQGGLDNKVVIRTFGFDAIKGLRIGNTAISL
jgi:hypothetical protein